MGIPEDLGTGPPKENGWRMMHFPTIFRKLFRMARGIRFDAAEDGIFADICRCVAFCILYQDVR